MDERIESLLGYWFEPRPLTKETLEQRFARWFMADGAIDAEIAGRFAEPARLAAQGALEHWADSARGRLALILLLDQVPRHLYRGTAQAFAQDAKALALTTGGIDAGADLELPVLERGFFYMPLQHAESAEAQELSVRMYEKLRDDASAPELYRPVLDSMLEHARLHRDIVARFGRFPHRNEVLGRPSTEPEREYLSEGAPRFGQ